MKKMTAKSVTLILAAVLAMGLAACSGKKTPESGSQAESQAETEQAAAETQTVQTETEAPAGPSEEEIAKFVEENGIELPVYQNPIDPVHGPFMVRDAMRSNPGIMVINKGVVKEKWAWRDFPEEVRR